MIAKTTRGVLFFLLIIFFFTGCASKKTITKYQDKVIIDSTSVRTNIIKTNPIQSTFIIEQPCDSLGNLKDFSRVIENEKAKVVIENVKGKLQVDVNIDSLVNIEVEKFKKNYKQEVDIENKAVNQYKYPLWLILLLLASVAVNIVLLKIRV